MSIDDPNYDPATYEETDVNIYSVNPEVNIAIDRARSIGLDQVVVKFSVGNRDGDDYAEGRGTIYLDRPNIIDIPPPNSGEIDVGMVSIINAGVPSYEYKLMATGHREPKTPEHVKILEDTMKSIIDLLKREHVRLTGVSGGALYVDTALARVFHRMGLPFLLVVPYKYEEIFIARMGNYNPAKSQAECVENLRKFRNMDKASKETIRIGKVKDKYTRGDTFLRNHAMVKMANAAIVVCKSHPHEVIRENLEGGTEDAIKKLHKEGFEDVFFIDWHNPEGYTMVNLQEAYG